MPTDYRDTIAEGNWGDRGGEKFNSDAFRLAADTDETASILRARDRALAKGGGQIVVPSWRISVSSQIELLDGISFHAPAGSTIQAKSGLTLPLFYADGATGISITGEGTIDGNGEGTLTTGAKIIHLVNCADCYVGGLRMLNSNAMAVLFEDSTDCVAQLLRIRGNESGIRAHGGSGHVIKGNSVIRGVTPGDAGSTEVRGIRGTDCPDLTIVGNLVRDYDLLIEVFNGCDNATITGNTCVGPFGISLDRSDDCTVTGNKVREEDGRTFFAIGIEMAGSVRAEVSGNNISIPASCNTGTRYGITCSDSGGSGVGGDDAHIVGNTITGGKRAFNPVKGDRITFEDNDCNNQTETSILVNPSVDGSSVAATPLDLLKINGNRVKGATDRGMQVRMHRGELKNNTVTGCGDSGIYYLGLANTGGRVIIEGNTCMDNCASAPGAGSEAGLYINNVFANTQIELRHNTSDSALNNGYANVIAGTLTGTIRGDWLWQGFLAVTNGDTTPSVRLGHHFTVSHSSATALSDIDDGFDGHEVFFVFTNGNTTVDFTSSNLRGRATDWTPGANDWLKATYKGGTWYCICSDNGETAEANTWTAPQSFTRTSTTAAVIAVKVNTDSFNRRQILADGSESFGDGTGATDAFTGRQASGVWGTGSTTSLKVGNSTWDGAHLILGAYHLWVDGSGKIRIKSGAPSSDTDGTVIGTQT